VLHSLQTGLARQVAEGQSTYISLHRLALLVTVGLALGKEDERTIPPV